MDSTFDISDQAILDDVTIFLAEGTESQKKKLCRFLREHPRCVTLDSIFPEKELPLKLELIGEIRRRLQEDFGTSEEPFQFSNIQLAALSLMSVETAGSSSRCLIYYQCNDSLAYTTFLSRANWAIDYITPKSVFENDEQREKCCIRDQRVCVLTKARDAIPCYIAPIRPTTGETTMSVFTDSILLNKLMGDVGAQFLGMVTNNDGCPVIQIQFNWMPRNDVEPDQLVEPPYDEAIDAMLQTDVADDAHNSFNYLRSGQSFEILLNSKEEAFKMKAALEFQWLAVRFAALCGTIKEWEWDRDYDMDEDEDDSENLDVSE
ncbi:hypothetical protein GGI35DRAFT_482376 [Trichoderma velutinum]